MIPEIKIILINLVLIVVVSVVLLKSKDYINSLVRKIIKRSARKARRFSDSRYKKRVRKIEKKNL